jgi:DNA-binding transcriptional ArsR family regulator
MTPSSPLAVVSDANSARAALTPLRRQLLARLREPASAAGLAAELGIPRQKLNYHLRVLERAGLLTLVEERPRRGCTERILVASADVFVLDPSLLGEGDPADDVEVQDRHASDHLVRTAAGVVRDVARMRQAADQAGARLLTLTVEAELRFATPADFDRFTEQLSDAIAELARAYSTPSGRAYRLVAGAHPAPRPADGGSEP